MVRSHTRHRRVVQVRIACQRSCRFHTRNFRSLCYFEEDGSVEMFDIRKRKTFLKRCVPHETIHVDQLVVGSMVTIMSRPLEVVEYLDSGTAARFTVKSDCSCMVILPDAYPHIGSILDLLSGAKLDIVRCRMLKLDATEATEFVSLSKPSGAAVGSAASERSKLLESDVVVAVEVSGADVVSSLHLAAGPSDPSLARELSPHSIRAVYGTDTLHNCVHVSACKTTAKQELDFLFSTSRQAMHTHDNCAVVIVKPHAVLERRTGQVVQHILDAGIEISNLKTMNLSRHDASDFLTAYKGVVPEHPLWVAQLSSGRSVAIQVRGQGIVEKIRELAGPYDPEIARHLRPTCLRALFGATSVTNCVHVTDLPHDGPLESQFLFEVLK